MGITGRWTRRAWLASGAALATGLARAEESTRRVPVLVYHRFAPAAVDGMTLRIATFEAHLRQLQQHGCSIVSLADAVDWRLGRIARLPPRAVALSADDGHRSQYELMAPRLQALGWPVTLFIYPSAISQASYAMRWPQLLELLADRQVALGSHTYWHPNLVRDRQRMKPDEFARSVDFQLRHSKEVLEQRSGQPVPLLAWPFGLSDEGVRAAAEAIGYRAAFSLGAKPLGPTDPAFALPRYLMTDAMDERRFARLLDTTLDAAA